MNDHADSRSTLTAATDGHANPLSLKDRVRSLRLPDQPARGQSGGSKLPWLLCLVLVGAGGYLGYRYYEVEDALRGAQAGSNSNTSAAEAAKLSGPAPGGVALSAGGYIVPMRRVQIAPKVGGEVVA